MNPQYLVLLATSLASFVLCMLFYRKSQMLKRLSGNSSVTYFAKTFNVLSLEPGRRRVLQTQIPLMLSFAILTFFLGYYILAPATPFLLGVCLAILCLGLMLVAEAYEMHKEIGVFATALRSGTGLGEGDMNALFFLNKTLPRLSVYYLLLGGAFLASFAASPFLEAAVILTLSHFVNTVVGSTSATGLFSAYLGVFLVAASALLFLTAGGTIKEKIFAFPAAIPATVLDEQFQRGPIMGTGGIKPPYGLSDRQGSGDAESEEKRRRTLLKKRK